MDRERDRQGERATGREQTGRETELQRDRRNRKAE